MLLISVCTVLIIAVLSYAILSKSVVPIFDESLPYGNTKYVTTNKVYFAFFAVLVLVSTFRYGYIDTYAYKEMYVDSRGDLDYVNSGIYGVEKGWLLFCYYLNYISPQPHFILFVSAVIIIGSFVFLIKKYSCDPIFSLFVFFCLYYMDTNNGVRQMVAAGLIMLTVPLFEKKKIWAYALIALSVYLAYQFHNSSIVFVIVVLCSFGKPINTRVLLLLIFSVLFIFISQSFTELFSNIIIDVFEDEKYVRYVGKSNGMRTARAMVTGVVPMVLSLFHIHLVKRNGQSNKLEDFLINVTLCNSSFVFMGLATQFWNRLTFYTAFAPMIMLPRYIDSVFSPKVKSIVKPLAVVLYFLFFSYYVYANFKYDGFKDFYLSLQ